MPGGDARYRDAPTDLSSRTFMLPLSANGRYGIYLARFVRLCETLILQRRIKIPATLVL